MARQKSLTGRRAWQGLLKELSDTPLGAFAAGLSILMGILQLAGLLDDANVLDLRIGFGGVDPLGWVAGAKLPMRLGVFVVYAATLGWSLGYFAVLFLQYGRDRMPPLAYIVAILWGLALLGSAEWLFAVEQVRSPGLYSALTVAGLIAAVWLARISIETTRKVAPTQVRDCVNMLGIFILSALVCSLLVEL